MKLFSKVIAMVLALIMTAALLPLSVFADTWGNVEVEKTGDDSVITVTVDPDKLIEVLKAGGISSSAISKLKDGLSVNRDDLTKIFSKDELFKIIPLESITDILNIQDVIDELGDDVMKYIDPKALLQGLLDDMEASGDYSKLEAMIDINYAVSAIVDYYQSQPGGLPQFLKDLLALDAIKVTGADGLQNATCVGNPSKKVFTDRNCFDLDALLGLIDVTDYLTTDVLNEIKADPDKYLTNSGMEKVKGWLIDATDAATLAGVVENAAPAWWDNELETKVQPYVNTVTGALNGFTPTPGATISGIDSIINVGAVKQALLGNSAADDVDLYNYHIAHSTAIEDLIQSDPAAYLTSATYTDVRNAISTDAKNLKNGTSAERTTYQQILDELFDTVDIYSVLNDNKSSLTSADVNTDVLEDAIGVDTIYDDIVNDPSKGFNSLINVINFDYAISQIGQNNLGKYVRFADAIDYVGTDNLFDILLPSGGSKTIADIIDIQKFIDTVGMDTIMGQFDPNELIEIVQTTSLKDAIPDVIKMILGAKLPYNINEITINGTAVAKEDTSSASGRLVIDIQTLLFTLYDLIPTLDELAALTTPELFSAQFGITYVADPLVEEDADPVTKNITVKFVLASKLEKVKEVAAKLNDKMDTYLTYEILPDGTVTADLTIPAKAASLYARVLNTDKVPAWIHEKILNAYNESGDTLVAFFDTLTLTEITEVFDAIDPEELFEKAMRLSLVESVIKKVKADADITNLTIDDFGDLIDDKVIDKVIDKVGTNKYVQKILNKIESKTGKKVVDLLDDNTILGYYEKAVEKATGSTRALNKAKSLVQKFSAKAPASLMALTIGDFYTGNGTFHASRAGSFSADTIARKLINKAISVSGKTVDQDWIDLAMNFIDNQTVTFNVDLTVHVTDVALATFYDELGNELTSIFLPKGIDLSIYEGYTVPTDATFLGWSTVADGSNIVTTMPAADSDLYAVLDTENTHFITFMDGTTLLKKFEVTEGDALSTEQLAELDAAIPPKTGYTPFWKDANDPTNYNKVEDLDTRTYTADTTFYLDYEINQYTVTFVDADGVTPLATFTVDYNTGLSAIDLDTLAAAIVGKDQTGYTIVWKDASDTEVDPATATFTDDTTLKLDYKINQYTVSFMSEDGTSLITSFEVDYNATLEEYLAALATALSGLERTGYTIAWKNAAGEEVDITTVTMTEALTLTMFYKINQYTVTFVDTDGVTPLATFTVNYNSGLSVGDLADIATAITGKEKTGYTIVWKNASDIVVNPDSAVFTDDTTLKLDYKINQYPVNFLDPEGNPLLAEFYLDYNSTLEDYLAIIDSAIVSLQRPGYTIVWKNAAGEEVDITTVTLSEALTLTMFYKINQYTVTFMDEDGTTPLATFTVDYNNGLSVGDLGDLATAITGKDKTGYTIVWKDASDASFDPDTAIITADVTLKLTYEKNTYTVTFVDGNGLTVAYYYVKYQESLSAADLTDLDGKTPTKSVEPEYANLYSKYTAFWKDSTGTKTDIATYSVEDDVTFTVDFEPVYITYTVKFLNEDGTDYQTYTLVKAGTDIGDIEGFDTFTAPTKTVETGYELLYEYVCFWYVDGDPTMTPVTLDGYTVIDIAGDTLSLRAGFTKNYFIKIDGNVAHTVTLEGGKTFVVTITEDMPTTLSVKLDHDHMMQAATTDDEIEFVIRDKNDKDFITIDAATLEQFYNQTGDIVRLTYTKGGTYTHPFYNATNSDLYCFEILCGSDEDNLTAMHDDFAGSVTITLPFTVADNAATGIKTLVHIITADSRTAVTGVTMTGNTVTIPAPHFSDYVIANEYHVSVGGFTTTDGVTLSNGTVTFDDTEGYYPAGASITFTVSVPNYNVTKVTYNSTDATYAAGKWTMVLGSAQVTLDVTVQARTYHFYYYVKGKDDTSFSLIDAYTYAYSSDKLNDAKTYHNGIAAKTFAELLTDASVTAPDFYGSYRWTGYNADLTEAADQFIYVEWIPTEYTIHFVTKDENGAILSDLPKTIRVTDTSFTAPVVPEREGYIGTWSGWTDSDVASLMALIGALSAGDELTFVADYSTEQVFHILHDGRVNAPDTAVFDEEVTVVATGINGYDAILTVKTADGTVIELVNNTFKMPTCNVTVTVKYVPATIHYILNGEAKTGAFGDVVTFQVTLAKGECLAGISSNCILVDSTGDATGKSVMTFAFVLSEDNLNVSYQIVKAEYLLFSIFNGKLTTTENPSTSTDKVKFAGWSDSILDSLRFAKFEKEPAESNYIALIIILIILAIIVLIALLYVLYINGFLKPNFLLRVITAIVGVFFAFCMFVARVGRAIGRLFGKRRGDYEQYGMENPDRADEE